MYGYCVGDKSRLKNDDLILKNRVEVVEMRKLCEKEECVDVKRMRRGYDWKSKSGEFEM